MIDQPEGDSREQPGPLWVFVQYMLAGLLAFFIVVPSLSSELVGSISTNTGSALRKISVSQHWSMYAPEAIRSMRYLRVTAHYADGREVAMQENLEEENGWGTQWFWTKRRDSIWRHRLTRRNAQRSRIWYLRGVCAREAARGGEAPDHVVMHMVRRKVRPPESVKAGKEVLTAPKTTRVAKLACRAPVVREMVALALEGGDHGQR